MIGRTWAASDAAALLDLPEFRILSVETLAFGQRRAVVETDMPPGCPSCGVAAEGTAHASVRDIPVGGPLGPLKQVPRVLRRAVCARLSFFETISQMLMCVIDYL